MGPFVHLRSALGVRAVVFLSLTTAAGGAALALDLRGGVGSFLMTAGILLVAVLAAVMLMFRSLRTEREVAPLPPGADIRDRGDEIRSALVRLPLWAVLVAMLLLLFGAVGVGMALGSSLALVAWVVLLRLWEASRALALFADASKRGRAWGTDSPHYYVRRLDASHPPS